MPKEYIMGFAKTINVHGKLMEFIVPKVMGILNVTPDSFYEGSRNVTDDEIRNRIHTIVNEGADIIDIGAYSTRPKAGHISIDEELRRLKLGLTILNKEFPNAVISVDTFRSKVAEYCVKEHGVAIVNDISGGEMDSQMFETVGKLKVPYVLTHMQGTPQSMQRAPQYDNIVKNLFLYFSRKVAHLHDLGVTDIVIDPGFGFGKTLEHNYELLNHLDDFELFNMPLLAGISRKSMVYKLLDITPEESLTGTIVLDTVALQKGANMLRVHDVREAVDSIRILQMLKTKNGIDESKVQKYNSISSQVIL